jgi:UDP-N-acetylglucosamine 2-epimerase (non-hydrolysing)
MRSFLRSDGRYYLRIGTRPARLKPEAPSACARAVTLRSAPVKRVLCLFGTRPEIIKLAPVLDALRARRGEVETLQVASSQHTDLLHGHAAAFGVSIDRDLRVMEEGQTPSEVAARVIAGLDPLLRESAPDLVLVQGDTTTAMAGALAAFHRRIPVAHVEAGLRTGDATSPFPEEMNRRLITRLATLHFAPTAHNVATLRDEGVPAHRIFLTGNPVVDALTRTLGSVPPSARLSQCLEEVGSRRLLVLTTHRRESFGALMEGNLRVLRRFVEAHDDVALAFPVHPNPSVLAPTRAVLEGAPRVHLLEPLGYPDFLHLLSRAWLIVSDSGGIQEEAPSLGKALLVLRGNTERPEALQAGVARLVGGDPQRLADALDELARDDAWVRSVGDIPNPFGAGDSGERIAAALVAFLHGDVAAEAPGPGRALSDFVDAAKREILEITPEEVLRILQAPDREGWHLVDVREPDEFAAGRLPGARSSPRGFLEVRADLSHRKRDPWFEDRERKLILYCGGGHRSALAARTLQEMGFRTVRSLALGWTGWTERGYPIER